MKFEVLNSLPSFPATRFVLRPLVEGDAAMIAHHTADRRLATATRKIPHPLPPQHAATFVARVTAPDRDRDVWAIDASHLGGAALLGVISLAPIGGGQAKVGYWVAPGYWNTGIASEAVKTLVLANPQSARTLFAEVFQDNAASARVLTNCGFEYLGDAEAFSVARGATVPTWTYLRKM